MWVVSPQKKKKTHTPNYCRRKRVKNCVTETFINRRSTEDIYNTTLEL